MICSDCGTQNEPGRKFCGECGTRLATTCPNCGSPNPPSTKFCGECGSALGETVAVVTPEPGAVEQHEISAAQTERRTVSVLFADLVDFTAHSEARDPEEVREFLSRYFELASGIIARYGGTVEKFIGDAVMAVWGTPAAHEDDPERAVRAALDLADGAAGLEAAGTGGPIGLRAAVMTGEAVVTLGATGQGMVAGDLVNVASRLQALAPPGGVLVGEATYRAASRAISFEPAGEHTVKGKQIPVPAWRAMRVVAARGGARRAERLETPFVGRDSELRLLKELFNSVAEERRARLVLIGGIGGIGKSRLAWELEKYVGGLAQPVRWHQGRSPAYGQRLAFWALGEMIREHSGIAETDDPGTTRAKLAAALRETIPDDAERSWIEPRLGVLLALEESDSSTSEQAELFSAWRRLFERIAERQTTVLVFEDLHWADVGLLEFIESLVEWSRTYPILVIGLARPELRDRRPDWGVGLRNYSALHLEPLAPGPMSELLRVLVPGLDQRFVRQILDRAEGVPLYAVETVRMLIDEGRLKATPDGSEVMAPIDHLEVPPTLHALVAARLDHLAPAERSLLLDAAVLGQTFSIDAVRALNNLGAEEIDRLLAAIVRRELLLVDVDPASPERGQYRFVQSVIREVAYSLLARPERRSRHLAAARHFEARGDDELAGVLANHYLDAYRATQPGPEAEALAAQTRVALRAAAERAASLYATDQALACLEHALEVTTDPSEQTELEERAGTLALATGRFAIAERHIQRAIEWHGEQRDVSGEARATARMGSVLLMTGRSEAAIVALEATLAKIPDPDTNPDALQVMAELARGYMILEEDARAIEMADRVLAAAARANDVAVIADALVTRGSVLMGTGRAREGIAVTIGALSLAEAHGLIRAQLRARANVIPALIPDDPAAVLANARAGAELALKLGQRSFFTGFHSFIGVGLHLTGDWDGAVSHFSEDQTEVADPTPTEIALRSAAISEIEAFRGAIESARARLADIEPLIPQISAPQDVALWHIRRSNVALAAGELEEAHDEAQRAVSASPWFGDVAYPLAGVIGALLGDLPRVRAALDGFQTLPQYGRMHVAQNATLRASIASLEANTDAARGGFQEAARAWRAAGTPFDLAMSQLLAVSLVEMPEHELRATADEAREIFTRLRAQPMLERLDGALAGRAGRRQPAGVSVLASGPTDPGTAQAASRAEGSHG